jgi:sulfur relay (sulfurtransferase) complex TusBCD TusD component (DsrE family)
MAKTLFILNDPPYGTDRSYNALHLPIGARSRSTGSSSLSAPACRGL